MSKIKAWWLFIDGEILERDFDGDDLEKLHEMSKFLFGGLGRTTVRSIHFENLECTPINFAEILARGANLPSLHSSVTKANKE